jgi:hypothetical protein
MNSCEPQREAQRSTIRTAGPEALFDRMARRFHHWGSALEREAVRRKVSGLPDILTAGWDIEGVHLRHVARMRDLVVEELDKEYAERERALLADMERAFDKRVAERAKEQEVETREAVRAALFKGAFEGVGTSNSERLRNWTERNFPSLKPKPRLSYFDPLQDDDGILVRRGDDPFVCGAAQNGRTAAQWYGAQSGLPRTPAIRTSVGADRLKAYLDRLEAAKAALARGDVTL